jgi:hypothetical protein
MRISELLEDASAGSTGASSIATVANPHVTNPYRSKAKKLKQPAPEKVSPSDNALDMDVSLFGGATLKR